MKHKWRFLGNEIQYLKEVILSGEFSATGGDMNKKFEKKFCELLKTKFSVTFNSGTSTLHAALFAAGVEYGDEVIQPPLTVISNLQVTLAMNAIPVFADVNEETFNIDPKDIEKKITKKTKAIQVVPLYGLPCEYDEINKIAKKHNLIVINDAAETIGASYKGKTIAECADISSFSFENSKHITTGDGGMLTTDNSDFAKEFRAFASLGSSSVRSGDGRIRDAKNPKSKDKFQDPKYSRCDSYGLNYRMPEVAAAVGLAQLERLDFFINLRKKIGAAYQQVCSNYKILIPQRIDENYISSYWTFAAVLADDKIDWYDFRRKYIEYGGDGIFACWKLSYNEPFIKNEKWRKICPPLYKNLNYENVCPIAEKIQSKIMQFVTNYSSIEEAKPKIDALEKTLKYFS